MMNRCKTHKEIIEVGKEVLSRQRDKKVDAISHLLEHYQADYNKVLEGKKLIEVFKSYKKICPVCDGHIFGVSRGFFYSNDINKPFCLRCRLDEMEKKFLEEMREDE